ncbi:hypothetical protein KUTeg_013820 [Tegillarca granosa]|uniref:Galectin n=1 Tax=Tegillarca granosa TaxID=220873 RepID=A0ABQ9EUS4_TEGGR|nr:hypothetical protein KUTeg_013820 [Tegillarca granosa]
MRLRTTSQTEIMSGPLQTITNCYRPPTPYIGSIPGGLTVGKQIFIQGLVPLHGNLLAINLACGPKLEPRDDVALHFVARFNENCVVRNTLQSGRWGPEERYGSFPFNKNYQFEVIILVEESQYKIAVNGQHFTEYQHRIPIHKVTHLTVECDVIISAVRIDAPIQQPMSYPASPQPMYNPPVPLTVPIQGGMFPGKMIFLAGTISPVAKRFTINIQDGMHGSSNKGLHFDVRINVDGHVNSIVAVNNQHFIEFKHRQGPLGRFNIVNVTGDITLQQVRFQ